MLQKSVSSILRLPPLLLGSTLKSFYYINSIFFSVPIFFDKNIWHFEKLYLHMFLLGLRRKWTALTLCKSIKSAIQWFQIHHRIIFATISNLAVYLSGARVSSFLTFVPWLLQLNENYAFSSLPICDFLCNCPTALVWNSSAIKNEEISPRQCVNKFKARIDM